MAQQLTSPEFVCELSETGPRPLRLKVSARAYVVELSGQCGSQRVEGAVRLKDGLITGARLASQPPRDWSDWERQLCGYPIERWTELLSQKVVTVSPQ